MTGLPTNVSVGTVTGKLLTMEQVASSDAALDSVPVAGSVIFTASAPSFLDALDDVILLPKPVVAVLDGTGSFSAQLAATDDPDLNPQGWTWTVSFELAGGMKLDAFSIEVPTGSTRNLADIAPVPDSDGVFYVTRPTTIADIPAGFVMYSNNTSRPTSRTDIMVIFTSAADPGSNAIDGDRWFH